MSPSTTSENMCIPQSGEDGHKMAHFTDASSQDKRQMLFSVPARGVGQDVAFVQISNL